MSSTTTIELIDWYQVLLIQEDATDNQIQVAYRKLAKKYHPDKNKSEEAVVMFEKISKAQQTLLNPEKREHLNLQLKSKRDREKRDGEMDDKRKRMKEDLLVREDKFKKRKEYDDVLKKNIEVQNMKFKEDYLKELFEMDKKHQYNNNTDNNNDTSITIKWRCKLNYKKDQINDIFTSFGIVESISIVENTSETSKYNMALINFDDIQSRNQVLLNSKDLKKKYKIKISLDNLNNSNINKNNNLKTHLYKEEIVNIVTNIPNTTSIPTINNEEEDDILNQMMNFKK